MIKLKLPHTRLLPPFFILAIVWTYGCNSSSNIKSNPKVTYTNMVLIPKGQFVMGGKSSEAYTNEFPRHYVKIDAFYMDCTEVTNQAFKKFIDATDYTPSSNLKPKGAFVFQQPDSSVNPEQFNWWRWDPNANWKKSKAFANHPVVNVSYKDACAYCEWKNKRLPTEAEWEWAAMGGIPNAKYPWTEQTMEKAHQKANFWQGHFPDTNSILDGFKSTAPVKSFAPNGYGLYDMGGNVWEWCADWYNESYYQEIRNDTVLNPKGAQHCHSRDLNSDSARVLKGGSFLCNDSYCSGYRVSRRIGADENDRYNHTGFRCVKDLP